MTQNNGVGIEPNAPNPFLTGAYSPLYDTDGGRLDYADQFAVPHVTTFASIISSAYRTYVHEQFDNALRKDPQYALDMQRDVHLQGCLQERKLATVSLKWHLEVDNELDPWQNMVKDATTKIVRQTPFLNKMMWALLDAIWYGKAGVQVRWNWDMLPLLQATGQKIDPVLEAAGTEPAGPKTDWEGRGYQKQEKQKAFCLKAWQPVHGDKFGNKFSGVPYLLITPWQASNFQARGAETTLTTRGGYGLVLRGQWRERFIIHAHELVDEDYFEAEKGEAIFGLGLRDRLFWSWWLRQEYMAWVVDFLERVGLGVTVWYYDASNPESKTKTEAAAKEQSRRSVILCPVWPNERGGKMPLIERLETPVAGVDAIYQLLEVMRTIEQRYIIGQDMSSETKATGLGSEGTAKAKMATKEKITKYDAANLEETLTGCADNPGLVSTIVKWTFPWCDFPVRWKFDIDTVNVKERMAAIKEFVDMGGTVKENEVRSLTGISDPGPDDATLGGMEQMMAGKGIGADGKPIGAPGKEEESESKPEPDGELNPQASPKEKKLTFSKSVCGNCGSQLEFDLHGRYCPECSGVKPKRKRKVKK
jgi:hypothetical protein